MRPIALLHGARIRRIDFPDGSLLALTLAAPHCKGVLIVSLDCASMGVGLVTERPRGATASPFVQKLRKELDGARIETLADDGRGTLEAHTSRSDGVKRLVLRFACDPRPNVMVLDAQGTVLAQLQAATSPCATERAWPSWPATLDALEGSGTRLLATHVQSAFAAQRGALLRGTLAADKRLTRKLASITADAERAVQAPDLRARATLLLANLPHVRRGARSVSLTDFTRDPPQAIEIDLDPASSAREQAEAWFQTARRFERGATIATKRATVVRAEQRELALLRDAIASAPAAEDLAALAAAAKTLGVRIHDASTQRAAGRAPRVPPRSPYRVFVGHAARKILVGRGAADNDALTLHHARPFDLWLHARDTAGAHVVVPLARGEACPPELLRDAALLAAHFSSARGEPNVDVIHTPRRYVSKRRGAPHGSVQVEREKVMRLDADPARLRHLLTAESNE